MTRLTLLALPLVAACACPAPDMVCDPVTDMCVCTGAVAASGPDDRDRAKAKREKPRERPEKEPEREPEKEREEEREEQDEGY